MQIKANQARCHGATSCYCLLRTSLSVMWLITHASYLHDHRPHNSLSSRSSNKTAVAAAVYAAVTKHFPLSWIINYCDFDCQHAFFFKQMSLKYGATDDTCCFAVRATATHTELPYLCCTKAFCGLSCLRWRRRHSVVVLSSCVSSLETSAIVLKL